MWRHWLTAGCVASLFGLVLHVLANIDAWILYEDAWQLTVLLATQILLTLAIGAAAATLGLVFSLPFLLWRNRRGEANIVTDLANIAAAIACGSLLFRAIAQWAAAVGIWASSRAEKYWLWAAFLAAFALSQLSSRARRVVIDRLQGVVANPISRRVVIASAVSTAALATTAFARLPGLGPRRAPRMSGPNVLLVTFDALSAEDMSVYGYRLPTTPHIDAFARRATVFTNFFASATFTTPSVASIMTGRYPSSVGVYQLGGHLRGDDRAATLIRELRSAGYLTAASVGNPWAYPDRLGIGGDFDLLPKPPLLNNRIPNELLRLPGSNLFDFEAGVEDFVVSNIRYLTDAPFSRDSSFPPALSFRQAIDMLRRIDGRYFLWIHVFAPHAPYLPAAPYAGRFLGAIDEARLAARLEYLYNLRDGLYPPDLQPALDTARVRYDEWIAEADAEFGKFMAQAEQAGWLNDTVVMVSSDHGESFQGGVYGHGSPLQVRPTIHTPLIVRLAGQTQGGRSAVVADNTALAPTILDLVGLKRPDWMDGRSLHHYLGGSGDDRQAGLAFTQHLERNSSFRPVRNGTLGVIDGEYRYLHDIAGGHGALTLLADAHLPGRDRSSASPAVADALRRQLRARFPRLLGAGA